jgi:transcriptional regulator GlxA family with amidase domain
MHQGCVRKQTQTRLYLVQWTGGWPDLEQTCHQVADYHGLSLPLVEWLLQKWRGGDPREEIDALMRTLFLLVRDLAQRPTQQRMSDKIHDLMVREIHHPYATDELARSVCMSRWHFCRQFKEETGMSPIQYFQRLRAERAVNLLRTTELSVREICRTIGFESPAHVSRIVRKHTGKTPTQIRREQGR